MLLIQFSYSPSLYWQRRNSEASKNCKRCSQCSQGTVDIKGGRKSREGWLAEVDRHEATPDDRRGLSLLMKESGELASTPKAIEQCWHHHFRKLFNMPSHYCSSVIDEMTSHPPHLELDDHPTLGDPGQDEEREGRGKDRDPS